MNDKHPCDFCKRICDCGGFPCVFATLTATQECWEDECAFNYEGKCKANLYDRCGAMVSASMEYYRSTHGKGND